MALEYYKESNIDKNWLSNNYSNSYLFLVATYAAIIDPEDDPVIILGSKLFFNNDYTIPKWKQPAYPPPLNINAEEPKYYLIY